MKLCTAAGSAPHSWLSTAAAALGAVLPLSRERAAQDAWLQGEEFSPLGRALPAGALCGNTNASLVTKIIHAVPHSCQLTVVILQV